MDIERGILGGYALIVLGFFLILLSMFTGESHAALFLIFPVIYGEGFLPLLGFLLIFAGMLLIFFLPFRIHTHQIPSENYEMEDEHMVLPTENKVEKKYGGVILIGPIPIVFGSDKNMALIATTIALIVLAIFLLFFLYG